MVYRILVSSIHCEFIKEREVVVDWMCKGAIFGLMGS